MKVAGLGFRFKSLECRVFTVFQGVSGVSNV